jgi:hypothetical protein
MQDRGGNAMSELSKHELARLEDEAIDGVPLSPDDALRVFDYLHAVEAERDALLKECENRQFLKEKE